jgi:hypothetical protein
MLHGSDLDGAWSPACHRWGGATELLLEVGRMRERNMGATVGLDDGKMEVSGGACGRLGIRVTRWGFFGRGRLG